MVKRYDLHHCVDDGDYVLYNDYAALEARVAELEMELRDTEYYSDMLVKHNIELESRLAELEKDAARYRWLRDSHNYPAGPYWDDLGNTCDPEEMDEMIDEAMRREA